MKSRKNKFSRFFVCALVFALIGAMVPSLGASAIATCPNSSCKPIISLQQRKHETIGVKKLSNMANNNSKSKVSRITYNDSMTNYGNSASVDNIYMYPAYLNKDGSPHYNKDIYCGESYYGGQQFERYDLTQNEKENAISRFENVEKAVPTGWYYYTQFTLTSDMPLSITWTVNGQKLDPYIVHSNRQSLCLHFYTTQDSNTCDGDFEYFAPRTGKTGSIGITSFDRYVEGK